MDKPLACPSFFDDRNSILKLLFNKIIPQHCNLLAVYVGMPFFEPKIVNNGLWSICNVNFLLYEPVKFLNRVDYSQAFFLNLAMIYFRREYSSGRMGYRLCMPIFKLVKNYRSDPIIANVRYYNYLVFRVKVTKW